jgi:flagellar basal body rod protein FlgG
MTAAHLSPGVPPDSDAVRQQLRQATGIAADAVRAIDAARKVSVENISNADTIGFKACVPFFEDGGKIHLRRDLGDGSLDSTGGNLDASIFGAGFFIVRIKKSDGSRITRYTRAGNFAVNASGKLLLNQGNGYELDPPITLPPAATQITIDHDGSVRYVTAASGVKSEAGQLKLAMFPSPDQLSLVDGMFVETEGSGPPLRTFPGEDGSGQIFSGFLEHSNVDVNKETARLRYLNEWRNALLLALGIHG